MDKALLTLEDRELSAVSGGGGGCGLGEGLGGFGGCGLGEGFGEGFGGFGDTDCGVETDLDVIPSVGGCSPCESEGLEGFGGLGRFGRRFLR